MRASNYGAPDRFYLECNPWFALAAAVVDSAIGAARRGDSQAMQWLLGPDCSDLRDLLGVKIGAESWRLWVLSGCKKDE